MNGRITPTMLGPTNTISETVIEDLYIEALSLADEARAVFAAPESDDGLTLSGVAQDEVRLALSIEGLRTTSRVMHVLAWVLNQRAYLSGELTRKQLILHGALAGDRQSEPKNMAFLELSTRALIRDTERLHARAARLDAGQRARFSGTEAAIHQLQGRISQAFGAG